MPTPTKLIPTSSRILVATAIAAQTSSVGTRCGEQVPAEDPLVRHADHVLGLHELGLAQVEELDRGRAASGRRT